MKRTKLSHLCLLFLVSLFIFSCSYNDDIQQEYIFDESNLDATGHAFMDVVKTAPDWDGNWQKLSKTGTPLPNEAITAFGGGYDLHYIVPIVSERKIIEIGIIPFDIIKDENGNFLAEIKTIEIVEESAFSKNLTVFSLFKNEILEKWNNNGHKLYVSFKEEELKESIKQSLKPTTRSTTAGYGWVDLYTLVVFQGETMQDLYHSRWDVLQSYRKIYEQYERFYRNYNFADAEWSYGVTLLMFNLDELFFGSVICDFVWDFECDLRYNVSGFISFTYYYASSYFYSPESGGGGGGTTTPDPEPYIPPTEPIDPCENVRNKTSNTGFNTILTALEGLTSANYEAGRAYTYSNGVYTFSTHNGSPNTASITWAPSSNAPIDGFIHTHYDGLLRNFSADDLIVPHYWNSLGGINQLSGFTFGLVTSDGTYFLCVSDVNKYTAFGNQYADGSVGSNALNLMYNFLYGITENTSSGDAEEALAKLLKATNSGLTLMKKGDNNSFKRLYVDSDNNVTEEDC